MRIWLVDVRTYWTENSNHITIVWLQWYCIYSNYVQYPINGLLYYHVSCQAGISGHCLYNSSAYFITRNDNICTTVYVHDSCIGHEHVLISEVFFSFIASEGLVREVRGHKFRLHNPEA